MMGDTGMKTVAEASAKTTTPPYILKDAHLAAFLVARGHRLTGVDMRQNPRLLAFERTPALDDNVAAYMRDEPIGCQTMLAAYKRVLRAIHDGLAH